jgi:exodeoxyribonuclease-3
MKILSFNVNGIRAISKKTFVEDMQKLDYDIICLQEIKSTRDQLKEAVKDLEGYHIYTYSAERKGYSGTAIFSRQEPKKVLYGIGLEEHDQEGRVIAAEYEDYFVVTVYVPNSGSEMKRLDYRQIWDAEFCIFLKKLEAIKPVVVCGDFNVAHRDIDLARPKPNYNKSAGYMQEEIDGMDRFIGEGLVDTFRSMNPETVKYSWWSYRAGAREKNVGWRIDYFMVSQSIINRVEDADILTDVLGSDHCPVSVRINERV